MPKAEFEPATQRQPQGHWRPWMRFTRAYTEYMRELNERLEDAEETSRGLGLVEEEPTDGE